MTKTLRLDSPTARKPLAVRDAPYYRSVAKGVAIGYRKGLTQSTWSVRRFSAGKYHRREIGQADDDGRAADGITIFSWADVLKVAIVEPSRDVGHRARYSVRQAVEDYFAHRRARSHGGSENLTGDGYKARAFLEKFGDMQVSDLTLAALQRWRDSLVGEPPAGLDDIARRAHRRAAQATTNRKWASVRAALNHAFNTGRVDSDLAWRRIKPFRAADAPRKRFLSVAECNKLLGASPPAFRNFVQAALLTGLRPGELTRLNVAAFEGTRLAVSAGKTGEGRHVSLTSDGQVFFKKLVKGRSQGAVMLINTAGERWTRQQWKRATKAAVEAAGLATSAVFYDLRRSYGSLLANAGAQDTVIAHSLGHADTRMVRKHYGHLLDETVARELEDKLPTFRATRPKHAKTAV